MVKINYRLFFWLIILTGVLLGASQFVGSTTNSESKLIINEFLAANKSGLLDEDGDFSDWIEIYNPGRNAVNLSGWAMTDDPNQPDKWTFPDISLGSHEYLVVLASGKNRRSLEPGMSLHTNFKLEKNGEFLAIYSILDEELIVSEFSTQYQDVSYGHYNDEPVYGYLTIATPGQPNNTAVLWEDTVARVDFSIRRGFYDTPFRLELTTGTAGATIRYTTDGSDPTDTNGLTYTQPIPIKTTTLVRATALKPNWRSSNVSTHTYIFLDDVLAQPANPPNFPETWGVHDETIKSFVSGEVVHADYEMDPEIVNAPGYREVLKDSLTSIPSISIVTDIWYAGFQNPDGKIKYFVWDGELTWGGTGGEVDFGKSNPPGYLWSNTVELFFEALIQNPDFKMEFADRLYKHLFNDGALTDANSQARLMKINSVIDWAIAGEFARWGDSKQEPPHDRDDWLQAIDNILAQMEGNADRLITLTRDAGYYPNIDPPTFNQQGGLVEAGFKLTMTASPPLLGGRTDEGIIFYTTDGSDPRTRGTGAVSPSAKVYEAPILLTTTIHIKARLFTGSPSSPVTRQVWSALNEATFSFVEQDPKLRITEIMYNPSGQDDTEFIELKNTGDGKIDLSGRSFEGICFIFPTNTPPLSSGEFITLVRNRQAFADRYPNISIDGVYSG